MVNKNNPIGCLEDNGNDNDNKNKLRPSQLFENAMLYILILFICAAGGLIIYFMYFLFTEALRYRDASYYKYSIAIFEILGTLVGVIIVSISGSSIFKNISLNKKATR